MKYRTYTIQVEGRTEEELMQILDDINKYASTVGAVEICNDNYPFVLMDGGEYEG